ncbi:hypothetical protein CEXT_200171 [Caerostris extrusa]|uniref:Uncharacterized protein n=1 Tax=Caerostris extrusa TaxID=172846 RepID=A0AAV4YC67_CAEEX|nr:hypothetical protein CEXT_200171 [Caerostris extrusa]
MAQLEGRIFELEKAASSKVNVPIIASAQTANEAIKPTFAAKNLDITKANIEIKRVSHTKNGGILVETVDDDGLNNLLKELKTAPPSTRNSTWGNPPKEPPNLFALESQTTPQKTPS